MAWYFRLVELHDGSWACRHGTREFDRHTDLTEAEAHIRRIAFEGRPAQVFLHTSDGDVRLLADL